MKKSGKMKKLLPFFFSVFFSLALFSQEDSLSRLATNDSIAPARVDSTVFAPFADTALRITNLNPFFTLHVDSMLLYQLQINKSPDNYFWYLKNAPVGLKIGKDNGVISFKAERAYFLSAALNTTSLIK
jgi:hypothetical protein